MSGSGFRDPERERTPGVPRGGSREPRKQPLRTVNVELVVVQYLPQKATEGCVFIRGSMGECVADLRRDALNPGVPGGTEAGDRFSQVHQRCDENPAVADKSVAQKRKKGSGPSDGKEWN